jgi:hypothetical protein
LGSSFTGLFFDSAGYGRRSAGKSCFTKYDVENYSPEAG